MSTSTAAIIIIGAEVLSAKVVDENGPFLLRALRDKGVEVRETRTIGDDIDVIARHVRELAATHTYVITTGGIGPTHDDLTMAGVAKAFDTDVVRDAGLVELISKYFGELVREPHLKMAEMPRGGVVTVHPGLGIVPVVRMRNVYVLAGVPALVRKSFAAFASELEGAEFYSATLYFNVTESVIADALTATQNDSPDVAIGSYPRFDDAGYAVKVTFDGRSRDAVDAAVALLNGRVERGWLVDFETKS